MSIRISQSDKVTIATWIGLPVIVAGFLWQWISILFEAGREIARLGQSSK